MRCLIGLGSNEGDRAAILERAIRELDVISETRVTARSSFYTTQPAGGPEGQEPFLNAAVTIETKLDPLVLLDELQKIEQRAGRQRTVHWGSRTLDVDLLLYGDEVIAQPELTVPHPRMIFRRFVLQPAAEIAADWVVPTNGWTVEQLWQHLQSSPRVLWIVSTDEQIANKLQEELPLEINFRCIILPHARSFAQLVARKDLNTTLGGTAPRLIIEWEPEEIDALPRFTCKSCPVYSLIGVDLATAVEEVIGAIEAMLED